jgi:hypothetical protein
MKTSRRTIRRAALGATLTAALGVTTAAFFAPAAAADPYPGCIDPVDGVTVCVSYAKVGPSRAVAEAVTNGTPTLAGVLVTLEECVDGSCRVVSTATGNGTGARTTAYYTVPGATYTATASWSDDNGRQHHGVQAVGY